MSCPKGSFSSQRYPDISSSTAGNSGYQDNFKVIEYGAHKQTRWWPNEHHPYWQVGANDLRFKPTHYTVRNSAATSCSLFNWTFAGSMDVEEWDVLDTRLNDITVKQFKQASYDLPVKMRSPMHYFRITHYGPYQCGDQSTLVIGSFDLYGVLYPLHPITDKRRWFINIQIIGSIFVIQ